METLTPIWRRIESGKAMATNLKRCIELFSWCIELFSARKEGTQRHRVLDLEQEKNVSGFNCILERYKAHGLIRLTPMG
jgi:hypothetical protein